MSLDTSLLTEEQKRGIDAFARWYRKGKQEGFGQSPRFKLVGPAGSGKSTLAVFALEAAGLSLTSPAVVKIAPTGKATYVMRQKGLDDAMTLHRAIYIPREAIGEAMKEMKGRVTLLRGSMGGKDAEERAAVRAEIDSLVEQMEELSRRGTDELSWVLNSVGPVASADLVLCDEASMVDGNAQRDLESFGVPVLYLGDLFQLPPVDDTIDSVFFSRSGRPLPVDFELTQIHRQAEGNPIIRHSRDIRLGLPDARFMGKLTGDDGGVLIRIPRARLGADLMAKADQVIVGFNNTRHDVNYAVREYLERKTPYPEPGDKLICLKNDRDHGVINGMMGVAQTDYYDFDGRTGSFKVDLEMDDGRVLPGSQCLVPYFQFPGDPEELRKLPGWVKKKFLHFDYGYAITCHKSQGSQVRSGIILDEAFGTSEELKRRWRYTAVTRFEHSVIIGV